MPDKDKFKFVVPYDKTDAEVLDILYQRFLNDNPIAAFSALTHHKYMKLIQAWVDQAIESYEKHLGEK